MLAILAVPLLPGMRQPFTWEGQGMSANEERNNLKVMVVMDLAATCKKVAENSAAPDNLRTQARELVEEFEALLPARGTGNPHAHFHGEQLLAKMARFLPRILEVESWPADSSKL
jgi:hypothetical protein